MAKKKYYAVKEGKIKGIYLTWADCKSMVIGQSNAVYKSFEDPYEAMDFLLGKKRVENEIEKEKETKEEIKEEVKEVEISEKKSEVKESVKDKGNCESSEKNERSSIEAYVDGSFDVSTSSYGSGVAMIKDGKVIEEISRKGVNPDNLSMRNVAGEIEAAMIAMEYCYNNGYNELTLYFDYNGIEKWATGEWKANKIGTKKYKEFCSEMMKNVKVNFVKVKAHTGVEFNELADQLAKKSIF